MPLRWVACAIDVIYESGIDLGARKNKWMLKQWMLEGMVDGVHFGAPCGTLSRARDRPGGPPPLRSDEHVCKPLMIVSARSVKM